MRAAAEDADLTLTLTLTLALTLTLTLNQLRAAAEAANEEKVQLGRSLSSADIKVRQP